MPRRSLDTLPQSLTPCPLAAGFREPVSRCEACGRDVLDLSTFTREEAAALLATAEPPCVRFVVREGRPVFKQLARGAALAALVGGAAQLHAQYAPAHADAAVRGEVATEAAGAEPPGAPARPRPAPPVPQDFAVLGGVPARADWK